MAESAYQALLLNIKALSEHVAAVQSANTVSDQVKQRLEETLARANKGWKKIKTERKKRRKKKHMTKERTMKQEEQQSVQHETVAAAAPHHIVSDTTNQLGAVNPPSSSAQQGGVVGGSNILQAMSFGNEEVGRKRRQLSDSSTADTTVDEEAEEDEDDDEEEEAAAQDVSPPLAFKAMPPLAVMSLTSPVSVPPNASTPVSLTPNAPSSSIPPSAAASYQSSSSTDGVSDAQAPVVMSCSKFPIAVLNVPVQRQYTMTRRDSKRMKRADKEALVNVTVRIMGTPDRAHIYFVAKDVCQLICLRKGSVAKAIHDFSATEKARMPVLCQRSSGSGCTQVLTVLTMAGVQRLMTSSRQPIARSVLQWLSERVGEIQAGQMPSTAFDPNATLQPADSTHSQPAAPSQQQPVVASDPTTILFPPQPSQLPSAPSGMSLYQQYGLSDMMVDAPVSPQIGFAGTRPSLSMTNFPQFPLPSQPGGHSLTSVSQFANHAFLGPTSMSLPSFSPVSSFGSSTSSYSLPGVAQLQPPTQLHSQQLLPVSYPSILSQLIGSSASTSPAFSTAHQPQSNSAGHSLFLSGSGGVNLIPGLLMLQLALVSRRRRLLSLILQLSHSSISCSPFISSSSSNNSSNNSSNSSSRARRSTNSSSSCSSNSSRCNSCWLISTLALSLALQACRCPILHRTLCLPPLLIARPHRTHFCPPLQPPRHLTI